ncbi:hypothetical protein MMC25_006079 [Agyrium rufum]|nr:hypothetical protein [Agyrium rufum]
MAIPNLRDLISSARPNLAPYESLRKHIHENPELGEQESETAKFIASQLDKFKAFDEIHTSIGGHGVAAVMRNGAGKTVLLRSELDGLPVLEQTGLEFASKAEQVDKMDGMTKPTMHACGHDMHMTCLLAATETLIRLRDHWSGTLIVLFQPNEERGAGAKAMVDGGLYDKIPKPDVLFGQHVMPFRAGRLGLKVGAQMAASDSFKITLFGRGGHGSMPNRTIDPVVMGAAVVMRLQTIVSREIDPSEEVAVVTVGSLKAGEAENVISDRAILRVNVRTVDTQTRKRVLAAIRRMVEAECMASNAPKPPLFEETSSFPLTINDEDVTKDLHEAFRNVFDEFNPNQPRVNGSEDFTVLGSSIGRPCAFWLVGCTDPEKWDEAEKKGTLMEDIPANHSPFFAPVMQPTLTIGTDALVAAALSVM